MQPYVYVTALLQRCLQSPLSRGRTRCRMLSTSCLRLACARSFVWPAPADVSSRCPGVAELASEASMWRAKMATELHPNASACSTWVYIHELQLHLHQSFLSLYFHRFVILNSSPSHPPPTLTRRRKSYTLRFSNVTKLQSSYVRYIHLFPAHVRRRTDPCPHYQCSR